MTLERHSALAFHEPAIRYRPDIDGLRAIAVLAVFFYHSGIGFVTGGFIGVDVFFVISGYLITSNIRLELERGTFTIAGFYDRRVRRIFPALFAMCALVAVAASCFLMPLDFKEFGESLVAISSFLSNVYFYIKTGYFAQEAELRPLLHTWSLAVEEQFYVFFPILLAAIWKRGRALLLGIIFAIFSASLLLAIVTVRSDSAAAFYLLWNRAWELLAGSILAFRILPACTKKFWRNFISAAGILLIALPVVFYSNATRFPGETAIPPVLGAALIIYAGESRFSLISRLLSVRPLVFIGLISYSLYLWHWPIFVFFRYVLMRDPQPKERAVLMLTAVILATLSWRYVESPFRNKDALQRRTLAAIAATVMTGLGAFGVVVHVHRGIPQRLPRTVARASMNAFDVNPMREMCDSHSPEQIDRDNVCVLGTPTGPVTFAVVGDSFADALLPGVNSMANESSHRGYALTRGGCLPLIGVNQEVTACRPFVDAAIKFVLRHTDVTTVILIGRWTTAAEGTRFGVNKTANMFISDDSTREESYTENRRVLTDALSRTIQALHAKKVFVAAFVPEQPFNVPRYMGMNLLLHEHIDQDVGVPRETFDRRQRFIRELLGSLAANRGIQVLDVGSPLCNQVICLAARDGKPLYVDDNHLTSSEAVALHEIFEPALLKP